jgi:ribose transport system permease protein
VEAQTTSGGQLLLAACLIVFGVAEERFLSSQNIFNVARQSTYLMIIAMGQMIVLITAGFDISVGSTIALVSVVSALVMSSIIAADPNAVALAITAGIAAGILTGALVGVVNGLGVAILNVPPFIMTLGMLSMALGMALILSGGQVIYGIPDAFSVHFSYGRLFGLPAPIFYTFGLFVLVYFLLNYTRLGRYLYAIGSNRRAAQLSGISTPGLIC